MKARSEEAFEVMISGSGASPVVLCCEHASNAHPGGWGEDAWLESTHWAWDPGAAQMTRDLAEALGSRAVLARFSRLLIDANRPLYSGTLFREEADGRPVQLNLGLTDLERQGRVERWWQPYHDALDETVAAHPAAVLLSVHSFTPVYDGHTREVELGVLFEDADSLAAELVTALQPTGLEVRGNEPYSGKGGMMFSCYRHASQHGLAGIELEYRQDLLADPEKRAMVFEATLTALQQVVVSPYGG